MRISPNQYFQNQNGYGQITKDYTMAFIIISIVAGVALGLAIASLYKSKK